MASIKSNEGCLKNAIWSPKILDNKELKKKSDQLKRIKRILCEEPDFWTMVSLTEKILNPLKNAILEIEGSVVDIRRSYKAVEFAFNEAIEIAGAFPEEYLNGVTEVVFEIFVDTYLKFSDSQ